MPSVAQRIQWSAQRAGRPRMKPFVSSDLDEYLKRYWALAFTVRSRSIDMGHIRHLVSWYAARLKVVELDVHPAAETLLAQVRHASQTNELPVLFVNKKLVGTLQDVQRMEDEKKLKDILHFGFEWQTGANKDLCGPLPSLLGTRNCSWDDECTSDEASHRAAQGAPFPLLSMKAAKDILTTQSTVTIQ